MESPFNQIALRSPFFDTGLSVFTPLSLFSASEPGAWYDPSDMSTMFQDAAGTTPVTAVEQPVSVILDKSKSFALGSDLVTNGTFNSSTTGWTANTGSMSVVSGELYVVNNLDFCRIVQAITTVVGKRYKLTGTARYVRGSGLFLRATNDSTGGLTGVVANSSTTTSTTNTNLEVSFNATSTTTYIALIAAQSGNVSEGYFDNISVKEIAGSHAYTPSTATASRPVLSARYNLLTKTEQFDDAVWVKRSANSGVTANATTNPFGGSDADEIYSIGNVTDTNIGVYQDTTKLGVAVEYRYSAYVKRKNLDYFSSTLSDGAGGSGIFCRFNLTNGTIEVSPTQFTGGITANFTNGSATISNVGSGWYLVTLSATTNTQTTVRVVANFTKLANGGSTSYSIGDGGYIWGADLRVANDGVGIPTYQRVNTSTDYDTTNFPMYLRFDGSDDYMLTGTITPGTDKAQVFAGVRKFTVAGTTSVLTELSVLRGGNNGSFTVVAPGNPEQYAFISRGSGSDAPAGSTDAVYAAPNTSVVTGISDIASDVSRLRLNSTQVGQSSADQGAGNFLAYPLYIGRRGGTTSPFNGRLFGLIVRFGANLSATQITNTETWMNGKTRAF